MSKLQGGSDRVRLPASPDYLGDEYPLSRSEAIFSDVIIIERFDLRFTLLCERCQSGEEKAPPQVDSASKSELDIECLFHEFWKGPVPGFPYVKQAMHTAFRDPG